MTTPTHPLWDPNITWRTASDIGEAVLKQVMERQDRTEHRADKKPDYELPKGKRKTPSKYAR